jgi:hypothetical protein
MLRIMDIVRILGLSTVGVFYAAAWRSEQLKTVAQSKGPTVGTT